MNKTIRNLAIAALFVFPGISGFPQEVLQDEAPAAKPVIESTIAPSLWFSPQRWAQRGEIVGYLTVKLKV